MSAHSSITALRRSHSEEETQKTGALQAESKRVQRCEQALRDAERELEEAQTSEPQLERLPILESNKF